VSATLTRDPAVSTQAVTPAAVPIPFRRLVRVEWGKATDTRAARWLIAITGVVTILIMLAPILAKHSVDQTYDSYLGFPALVLGMLLPIVSILTLTTEWTQRTVLTTFTQEPRRARITNAKVTVSLLIGLLAAGFGALVTVAAAWLVAGGGRHLEHDISGAQAIGFVLFVLLNMMMGVAFGALLHNTAASIVLFFILPAAFGILGGAVKSVGHWIDPGTTFGWILDGHWDGHVAQIAVSSAIWLVLPLTAGLIRTARREIK
jgi:ABC-type transport system involved in multi-copper enzyme maturation permease subunit